MAKFRRKVVDNNNSFREMREVLTHTIVCHVPFLLTQRVDPGCGSGVR